VIDQTETRLIAWIPRPRLAHAWIGLLNDLVSVRIRGYLRAEPKMERTAPSGISLGYKHPCP
jgi:hypothetical protein